MEERVHHRMGPDIGEQCQRIKSSIGCRMPPSRAARSKSKSSVSKETNDHSNAIGLSLRNPRVRVELE